jgi:hypothetical protein
MDVRAGQTLAVEVLKTPRTDSAVKTLIRLFRRDPAVARVQRRLKQARPSWESWRRGGRQWHHQMKSEPPVSLQPGTRYTVRATLDILRDLESVQRWVKVTPQ